MHLDSGYLVESGFKRHFGVDSGGCYQDMVDISRFDSFMFVLPLVNILLIQV